MRLRMFQVDAFTSRLFGGNPAAVVPLPEWLDEATMQAIALENNLSETAFFVGGAGTYHLRWFTPTVEVPLCGHATLASAFVILTELDTTRDSVLFDTLAGVLRVGRGEAGRLTMDFPRRVPTACEPPPGLLEGLAVRPREILQTGDEPNYYAVYGSESEVRSIRPDLLRLERLHPYAVVVTAPGERSDFVSRYFAPSYGVPEDPVTGSIHCALAPLWSARLGRARLHAHQVSRRGGELWCEDLVDRVLISGSAVKYLEGEVCL